MTVEEQITAEAFRQGVPPKIALAVAQRESGMNPDVGQGASGEIGLFQVKPSTAQDMGVWDLEDVSENIRAGVSYLSWNFSRYGDWSTALMAYNGGPGNVDEGTISSAAANYAQQVLASVGLSPSTGQPMVAFTSGAPSLGPVISSDEAGYGLLVVGVALVVVLVWALD